MLCANSIVLNLNHILIYDMLHDSALSSLLLGLRAGTFTIIWDFVISPAVTVNLFPIPVSTPGAVKTQTLVVLSSF